MKIAVGGTFQPLHDGHKLLLRTAYGMGGNVDIGITSDNMATGKRTRDVDTFEHREKAVRDWVRKEFGIEPHIMKIDDPYGKTLTEAYDYIVVSPETYSTAVRINQIRKERGMKPIAVVRVDYVLAEDGKPISSTRIVEGEIDAHGNLLRKESDDEDSGRDY